MKKNAPKTKRAARSSCAAHGCISAVEAHDHLPQQSSLERGDFETKPERQTLNELHLFAGCGGGILGGILLGHHPVCAVEIEPYCRKVLLQRQRDGVLPRFPIWDDVRTFDGKPWRGRVDVVCGGFPCQDISAAGKGAGIEGERSGLWSEFARIIREVGPRYAFVENSPMLTSRGLGRVLGDLAEMGYDARWGVLGADDAGAPHRRKRIWILANALPAGERGKPREGEAKGDAFPDAAQLFSDGRSDNTGISPRGKSVSESGNGSWPDDVANVDLPQCERAGQPGRINTEYTIALQPCSWWRQDPAETPESGMGRMAHGVANRVDRLKALGNGQVPQVVALAWRVLSGRARLRGMRVELPKGEAVASEGRKYNDPSSATGRENQ